VILALFGFVFLFGLGHLYAGRKLVGLLLLVGCWAVVCGLVVGRAVGIAVLVWFVLLVVTPIWAAHTAMATNRRAGLR
jgi:hypothetical protein